MLRLITAPFVVPLASVSGLTVPFTCDPELDGDTNVIVHAIVQTLAIPLYVGVNTLVGSCACGIDAARGLADIVFLGYYDLPDADEPELYDARPYFLQISDKMSRADSTMLWVAVPASTKNGSAVPYGVPRKLSGEAALAVSSPAPVR